MNYKFEFRYETVKTHLGATVRQTRVNIQKLVKGVWLGFANGEVTQHVDDQHSKEKARKAAIKDALRGPARVLSSHPVIIEERTEIWADYFARLIPKKDKVKRMNLQEFRELGYLQEVNRGFFHPHGLALEMTIDKGKFSISGVWDYREDPEGIIFTDGTIDPEKITTVKKEFLKHSVARLKLFGQTTQPYKENDGDGRQ